MRALTMDEVGFVSGGTAPTPPPREAEIVVVTGHLGGYFSGAHLPQFSMPDIGVGGSGATPVDFDFDLDGFFERAGSNQTVGQFALNLGSLPGNSVTTTAIPGGIQHVVGYGSNGNTITVTDFGGNGSLDRVTWRPSSFSNYLWVPGSGWQPTLR
jgi:hypothetical protein